MIVLKYKTDSYFFSFLSMVNLTFDMFKRWMSRSWIACKLKLSSTFVNGQTNRWMRQTLKRRTNANNQCILDLKLSQEYVCYVHWQSLFWETLFICNRRQIEKENATEIRLLNGWFSLQKKIFYFPSRSFDSCSSFNKSSDTYFASNSCFFRSNKARSIYTKEHLCSIKEWFPNETYLFLTRTRHMCNEHMIFWCNIHICSRRSTSNIVFVIGLETSIQIQ